jgi:hypothetical protein
MSKFKIGDTIHFMEFNKPKEAIIKGIIEIQGFVETSGMKKDVKENETCVLFSTGSYSLIEEDNAFQTAEKLMFSLFNSVKN